LIWTTFTTSSKYDRQQDSLLEAIISTQTFCSDQSSSKYSDMGSHSSKADREPEGSGASGSHSNEPVSRRLSKRGLDKGKAREEHSDAIIKDANLNVIHREPLDKRDPWGHMARVVHSRHSSGFDE
jgi:hypothetical protein